MEARHIAKWDGSVWSALGSGTSNTHVSALAFDGTNLYTGGTFTSAGGKVASNIAGVTVASTTPDPLAFTDITDVALSSILTSEMQAITGITTSAGISITGGEYSLNGAGFTNIAGTANNGDTLQLRTTSSASYNTTTDVIVNVGDGGDTWSVTTLTDTVPDAFSFVDQNGLATNVTVTSNSIVITGLGASSPISIAGGEYSINGGAFTSLEGLINNNDSVVVHTTSSSIGLTPADTVLTIGGISDTFTVTTLDNVPGQFSYYDRTGAQLNRLYNSTNSIQVSGILADAPISVTGGEYSIDGGAWTSASGTLSNLSRVLLRQTSAATGSTQTDTVLTIGGVSATFSVTTKAFVADTTPNQFNYYDRTSAQLNRLYNSTNSIQVSGINADASISITGGEYSIDGGAWTSASGTVSVFSRVLLRQTSASTGSTQMDTVLTIGGVSATFSVTTKAAPAPDTTPNQFSYYDRTNAQLNRLYNSTNSIQVSGINADAPISVTGGEYSIDGGTWTSAPGTVSVFSRVLLRQTSAATNNTQTDTVLTIGGISATFSITTKP